MALAEPLTGDNFIDATTSGYRWILDASRTVDWSISNGFDGEYWLDPGFTVSVINSALSTISRFANISFNYVGTFNTPTAAAAAGSEINVSLAGNDLFTSSSIYAIGLFPSASFNSEYEGAPGDGFLNVDSPANDLPYTVGSAGWTLLLHEIGHILGLKHPHDAGTAGRPTFDQINSAEFDREWYSVMSYHDDRPWNQLEWHPTTPMVIDVLALQYLYGKNMAESPGDTVYQLTATSNYATLWDAGGQDMSAAGSSVGWYIYMPDDVLSSQIDTLTGLAVPISEMNDDSPSTLYWLTGDMEEATGSAQGDIIIGSRHNNRILGEAGADTIEGWGGEDILAGGDGADSMWGGDAWDFLHGNKGDDTLHGEGGGDWVVGGQDSDLLFGDEGDDYIVANLGADTCYGGDGRDTALGGQADDSLFGDTGDDRLSGDLGNDTLTGGAGADRFDFFAGAGVDKVTDFSLDQGDWISLQGGGGYSLSQQGADAVLTMAGGGQLILVGVTASSIPAGSIIAA